MLYTAAMSKTVVYIDAANILISAERALFHVDMPALIHFLRDKYRANTIVYFTGRLKRLESFFETVALTGAEMVYKQVYIENDKTKANCDVEIAHRFSSDVLLGEVGSIVLVSGDGDFVHLLDFAQRKNIPTKVVAFAPQNCSRMIKQRAFTQLSYVVDFGNKIKHAPRENPEMKTPRQPREL
jgi:uncharacterized LabA/DUF88 family protein